MKSSHIVIQSGVDAANADQFAIKRTKGIPHLLDAQYAKATSEMARTLIAEQAGTALLSDECQVRQLVHSLLH
jgi:flagellin-like hook-associated protein FlgL